MSKVGQPGANDADSLSENGPHVIRSGARGLFNILMTGAPMDPALQWVGLNAMNMLGAWRLSRGTVRHLPFVADEEFRTAFAALEESMADLLTLLETLTYAREMVWPRDAVMASAWSVEEHAYNLATQVGGEERVRPVFDAQVQRKGGDETMPGVDEMAMAYLRNQALEVAGVALSIWDPA